MKSAPRYWLRAWALLALSACASIPKGQYGVDNIEWIGMKKLSHEALEACLVTRERERVTVRLGIGTPSCGDPPFDASPPTLDLWTMPWTDWPIFDPAIFDVERERIERWYQARGYYDAHVLSVKTFVGDKEVEPDECHGSGGDCQVKIVVQLKEGEPVRVGAVTVVSNPPLPAALMEGLRAKLALRLDGLFDESGYEADKALLHTRMLNAAYARAEVSGHVVIDRDTKRARVEYRIVPGPACVFGSLKIEGAKGVPTDLLIEAASIPTGKPYSQEVVDDAQRAIFALGVFSSVKIESLGDGSVVDLVAKVQTGRIARWSLAIGVMSGTLRRATSEDIDSVAQWDVHLKGTYENTNFLGGLRKLRIEERPRLIMQAEFPAIVGKPRLVNDRLWPPAQPQLGNVISVRFEQPSTFEARTKLVMSAAWDVGPDPYQGFFRHDIAAKVGFERPFWKHRILGRLAVAHDLYIVTEQNAEVPNSVSDYKLPFLEQQLVLDLRDNPLRPKWGGYLSLLVQEASRLGSYGSWNYVRWMPDARAYVPLFWDLVLAARFTVGALVIGDDVSPKLDPMSKLLGPQSYRLRGGGANSNRGFAPGRLGDGLDGGTRSWLGSLELRIPLGGEFGVVVFGDVGDVHSQPKFRFSHLNAATGFGLRYHSILGALRFDAAWRVPGWQVVGSEREEPIKVGVLPSAVHLTIGEAF